MAQTARGHAAEVRLRLAIWQRPRDGVGAQMAALKTFRRRPACGKSLR